VAELVSTKTIALAAFILGSYFISEAQKKEITFYKHIQPIIKNHCQTCHAPGKAAPFSLLTYEDVASKGSFIADLTATRYMPPWKADNTFQTYLNERILPDSAIAMIQAWVAGGLKKGKQVKEKNVSMKPNDEDVPDLTIVMPEPYAILTDEKDDYRFFNLPTSLPEDRFITKISFRPGNRRLVHHSRLMTDTTHRVRSIHGLSANDPQIGTFEKYPPLDKFLYGWVPGNFPISFPKGTGKRLHRDTDIILNIHYAPNGREGQTDQSRIDFYFAEEEVDREVFSLSIAEGNISNPPFIIPANETRTFYSNFGPIPVDISAVAVLPHMHYLGKTFRAFAITPDGDAIHLIRINDWDFKWQDTYQFKKLLFIPKGSTIIMEGTFDNTSSNAANPNNPPKDVTYGWNTTSEMFDLVIYYLNYKTGDESLNPYD
jgi:hypothetical protein